MALPSPKSEKALIGSEKARIAPPTPARSLIKDYEQSAASIGLTLRPWQRFAGRYMYAVGPDGNWLYPEVAIVVARQNGKTEMLVPHIMRRLKMGRRILHAAQTRELPRLLFDRLAPLVQAEFGLKARVRKGAGQETIQIEGGGFYKIVAASGGAPRGLSIDDVLLDELRELDQDFVGSALPTTTASANPQIIYLSNAGSETSTVLNAVRARSGEDPALAYLEWSAAPDRSADDPLGWAEANPSLGHLPSLMGTLSRQYMSARLGGTLPAFETEQLCRWVVTIRQLLVEPSSWLLCHGGLEAPRAPSIGVSMSPDGKRASVAVAWMREDDTVGLRLAINGLGDPIDTDELGRDVKALASKLGARDVGFDPLTDAELAKFLKKPTPISGQKFANASAIFVNRVNARKIVWDFAEAITDDLTWTSRKHDHETGSYQAVRAQDDRPITAALAAIRAVWLASGPKPATPRVM